MNQLKNQQCDPDLCDRTTSSVRSLYQQSVVKNINNTREEMNGHRPYSQLGVLPRLMYNVVLSARLRAVRQHNLDRGLFMFSTYSTPNPNFFFLNLKASHWISSPRLQRNTNETANESYKGNAEELASFFELSQISDLFTATGNRI